jgi:phosphonate transport system substrate-binding protein
MTRLVAPLVRTAGLAIALLLPVFAAAEVACTNRGDLDAAFCDENSDLTADPPTDASRLRNPSALLMSYSPQEDTGTYEKLWAPYVAHLGKCIGKPVRFFQVHSSAAVVEAFRSGRIHFSLLATGDTPFAVNVAGAVPYAGIGGPKGLLGYRVVVIVRRDSSFTRLADLKGKRVAHTAPSSNSGNMAPRALFPAEGLVPDKDYKVIYSGKHDNSILGVLRGDYDAAAVADDILERLASNGVVKAADFRVLYTSRSFPAGSMVFAHDLAPPLIKSIRDCTLNYKFSPELAAAFQGSDRFVPLDYKRDFENVRQVANASGELKKKDSTR